MARQYIFQPGFQSGIYQILKLDKNFPEKLPPSTENNQTGLIIKAVKDGDKSPMSIRNDIEYNPANPGPTPAFPDIAVFKLAAMIYPLKNAHHGNNDVNKEQIA